MVEKRTTDPRRIAELLASELDGRSDAGLDRVQIANADRSVEPTESGARAYDVYAAGTTIATVSLRVEGAVLAFSTATDAVTERAPELGLETSIEPATPTVEVRVPDGASVKRATDVVAAAVAAVPEES